MTENIAFTYISDKQAASSVIPRDVPKPPDVVVQEQANIVTNGVNEITDVMKGSYSLSDVLTQKHS